MVLLHTLVKKEGRIHARRCRQDREHTSDPSRSEDRYIYTVLIRMGRLHEGRGCYVYRLSKKKKKDSKQLSYVNGNRGRSS